MDGGIHCKAAVSAHYGRAMFASAQRFATLHATGFLRLRPAGQDGVALLERRRVGNEEPILHRWTAARLRVRRRASARNIVGCICQ